LIKPDAKTDSEIFSLFGEMDSSDESQEKIKTDINPKKIALKYFI